VRNDGDLNVGILDQRKAVECVPKYISKVNHDQCSTSIKYLGSVSL
jgi:hypothetical protein